MRILKKIIRGSARPVVNQIKGSIGEARVDARLNPILFDKVEHKQINNLMLKDENGKTHQIDHIEIRENGVFCIETKNYSGWIFGSENQGHWTQVIYGNKNQIPNPIKQNKSHIYYVNKVLNEQYRVNSIIVMAQNNADKVNIPYVININRLREYLRLYDDGTHLSESEMNYIYTRLINANNQEISKLQHIQNIHNTQESIKQNICPRCQGTLVLRNGKYGQFYGCSNYPKCKFTLNVK